MKIKYLIICLPLLLSSCAIYRQKFDCPPDPGVPCTSVTDLEQMIIETDSGPDIFVSNSSQGCRGAQICRKNKVWIAGYKTCDGCWIPGHYIEID